MSTTLLESLLSRRSIRRYQKKDLPKDVLDNILEAGRQAPSAANRQPWHFIVVTDDETKKQLSNGLFNKFIKDSPVTIIGCTHNNFIAGKWSIISTTIAMQNMVIAAHAMGVGSCWIGDFKEKSQESSWNSR